MGFPMDWPVAFILGRADAETRYIFLVYKNQSDKRSTSLKYIHIHLIFDFISAS